MKKLGWLLLLMLVPGVPAHAGQGFAFSQEALLAPLNKQSERYDSSGNLSATFGRETTEFAGFSAFYDLNANWRVLYGLQAALAAYPLFKLSSSLALMLNTPYNIPLRPYLLAGLDPLLSADPALQPLSLSAHGGFGVEYSWDNRLYLSFELRTYFVNPYRARESSNRNLTWPAGSFSLGSQAGFLF